MPYLRKRSTTVRKRTWAKPVRYSRALTRSSTVSPFRKPYRAVIKKRSPLKQRARRFVAPKIPFYRR